MRREGQDLDLVDHLVDSFDRRDHALGGFLQRWTRSLSPKSDGPVFDAERDIVEQRVVVESNDLPTDLRRDPHDFFVRTLRREGCGYPHKSRHSGDEELHCVHRVSPFRVDCCPCVVFRSYPGLPFWASQHGQHSRATSTVQRFSHCFHVRSCFLRRSGLQIGSGQGVPATPAATLPTPLRPCLSATPRSGCPALAALPSGHRQRPDPAQHVTEQPPVQMPLGQQQPVVAGMLDQTAAGLH